MEYNFKHTPGPWRIGDHGDDVVSESSENISGDIVAEAPKDWHDSYEYWPANAKLISAAPDLLECAFDVIELLRANKMTSAGTFMNLVVAVEKATGIKIDVPY